MTQITRDHALAGWQPPPDSHWTDRDGGEWIGSRHGLHAALAYSGTPGERAWAPIEVIRWYGPLTPKEVGR